MLVAIYDGVQTRQCVSVQPQVNSKKMNTSSNELDKIKIVALKWYTNMQYVFKFMVKLT